jgi:hypothetical protein
MSVPKINLTDFSQVTAASEGTIEKFTPTKEMLLPIMLEAQAAKDPKLGNLVRLYEKIPLAEREAFLAEFKKKGGKDEFLGRLQADAKSSAASKGVERQTAAAPAAASSADFAKSLPDNLEEFVDRVINIKKNFNTPNFIMGPKDLRNLIKAKIEQLAVGKSKDDLYSECITILLKKNETGLAKWFSTQISTEKLKDEAGVKIDFVINDLIKRGLM